jgi:hypothetical protein
MHAMEKKEGGRRCVCLTALPAPPQRGRPFVLSLIVVHAILLEGERDCRWTILGSGGWSSQALSLRPSSVWVGAIFTHEPPLLMVMVSLTPANGRLNRFENIHG